MKKLTPAQQQYMDIKRQYADFLVFFRLGDFYELFYEDAKIAHQVLGITLTSRDKNAEDPIPMAGIPHHALEKYLPKLMHAGYKVVLADQVGEVVPGKLVERKVTELFTPGTRIEEGSLTSPIVAIAQGSDYRMLARGDPTLGEWTTATCPTKEELLHHVVRLAPREVVCDTSVHDRTSLEHRSHDHLHALISVVPVVERPEAYLLHLLEVSTLEGFGDALTDRVRQPLASLFSYLESLQQEIVVRSIKNRKTATYFHLDLLTIKNLEIFQGSYQGNKKQSLFGVINTCATSMGSRLLHEILTRPSQDIERIHQTQQSINYYYQHIEKAGKIASGLGSVGDISRICQSITQKKSFIKKIHGLSKQIRKLHTQEEVDAGLKRYDADLVVQITDFADEIGSMMREDIQDEYDWLAEDIDADIDALRHMHHCVDEELIAYQRLLSQRTGVSVKVKYITNQGYLLEVTPKDIEKFETVALASSSDFGLVRSQTLKTGQRYVSAYLQEIQQKLLDAQDQIYVYHETLAETLYQRRKGIVDMMYAYADLVGMLDLHVHMAILMHKKKRITPTVVPEGEMIIKSSRHPVVEAFLPHHDEFVPNDVHFHADAFFHLITGPNMGGKSTYMRQLALCVLLTHAGLPIPAKEATIPLCDGLFARIGSGDVLTQQQSTFMTEMLETAAILHNATAKSFIIIDELGRGTSTRDGLALAKAISVYICRYIKAKVCFSTHYHELLALEDEFDGVENWHVGVHETETDLVFLKKILRGGTKKSYGIDVAKLAGIPKEVLDLAGRLFDETPEHRSQIAHPEQSSLFQQSPSDLLVDELRKKYFSVDINTLTPLEAMYILQEIFYELRK